MKYIRILIIILLVAAVFSQVHPAHASATVDDYSTGCSSFAASGTTTADYINVQVSDPDTEDIYYIGNFPIADGSFTISVTFPAQEDGKELYYSVWGSPIPSTESWDEDDYFETTEECGSAGADGEDSGHDIPEGFELHYITCDVAVFDEPDGTPVGDNRIIAGQTWYINPEPEEDEEGELWTEIFVSSLPDPYIPTFCVGARVY